ncbi:MAG: four helix bundle protein [Bacteroidetes bacterium QS_7_67_15]|nr:MAG: four helix bundle protein [Bacteroidetes bacterium QS_7_67_15]
MATFHRFEDIESWQKARRLARRIYELTGNGDFARDFGLRDQIRRAAVSIMSNIAEGFERDSRREFARFLDIARASTGEVRSQLYVACDIGYLDECTFETLKEQCEEIARLLSGLIRYLRNNSKSPST